MAHPEDLKEGVDYGASRGENFEILGIWGENDSVGAGYDAVFRAVHRTTMVLFKTAGRLPQRERPADFARIHQRRSVMALASGVSAKLLRVLDPFTIQQPVWTAEALSEILGYAVPTCYRYLRHLTEAGFVQRIAGGRYSLGYRIIALDHIVRHSDPLLQVAVPVMRDLASRVRCDVMLSSLYGNEIWTTHHEIGGARPVGGADVRGRRLPLFRGAGSKVILANLPTGKLRALYYANVPDASAAGVGDTWQAFREGMIAIRKKGFHVANSEIRPQTQTSALAVAICSADRSEVRALQLVATNDQFALIDKAALAMLAIQAAGQIAFELAHPENSTS